MTTTKDLTKIEKRFAKNYYEREGMKYDPKNINIKFIREMMEETAYHEAGHFVAKIFTDTDVLKTEALSIIPDKITNGRITYRSYLDLDRFINPIARRCEGYKLLLFWFVGDWTTMIIEQDESNDYSDYLSGFSYDIYKNADSMDISKAQKIADIISGPRMPAYKILSKAYKWTGEMLKIPSVWNAVETVAKILLSKGEINNKNEEITDLRFSLDVPRYFKFPKWKRRLSWNFKQKTPIFWK